MHCRLVEGTLTADGRTVSTAYPDIKVVDWNKFCVTTAARISEIRRTYSKAKSKSAACRTEKHGGSPRERLRCRIRETRTPGAHARAIAGRKAEAGRRFPPPLAGKGSHARRGEGRSATPVWPVLVVRHGPFPLAGKMNAARLLRSRSRMWMRERFKRRSRSSIGPLLRADTAFRRSCRIRDSPRRTALRTGRSMNGRAICELGLRCGLHGRGNARRRGEEVGEFWIPRGGSGEQ